MSEITENVTPVLQDANNSDSVFDTLLNGKSPLKTDSLINNLSSEAGSSDDESRAPVKSAKRRIKRFSDSDSEIEADKENIRDTEHACSEDDTKGNISENDHTFSRKSRLLINSDSSDSDTKSEQQESRIGNKRNKLHEKFKGLLKSRAKEPELRKNESPRKSKEDSNNSSDNSNSGIESIKQKTKQKSMVLKSGICDPDTSSDEETSRQHDKHKKKQQKQRSTILTSPKPARMSAKQAMENMQKIKSESNRMLREKEVSLPYHRPKALSLKDIMSRRKPALSADGKVLPVKMNNDQLKQYVKLLEQRNKEIMELCKSDTEEEEPDTADETNPEPCAKDTEESAINSTSADQEIIGDLPVVNMTKATDEELPDLTVEIVPKAPVTEGEKIIEDLLNSSTKILFQKEQVTDTAEKGDADMKNTLDDSMIKEPKSSGESQLIELHYDTEKVQNTEDLESANNSADMKLIFNDSEENVNTNEAQQDIEPNSEHTSTAENPETIEDNEKHKSLEFNDDFSEDFSDADINMEDLENIIENAKSDINATDVVNSPLLVKDLHTLNMKPKLAGAPGMVIDLDGSNPIGPRKLTGVELLKERFTYFSKLKTPEEKERERESRIKPGLQHLKLKQELEDSIAEQRSLEWAKRLEDEKQQQMEMDAIRGDESDVDDIEKIEAKLEKNEIGKVETDTSSESEEEEEELCDIKEAARKKNPLLDDEAEVSDDDETGDLQDDEEIANENNENEEQDNGNDVEEDEESDESSDETSEDEEENQSKPRKSRILKAFEDSDDEIATVDNEDSEKDILPPNESQEQKLINESQTDSQDDVLPLAQTEKSFSEDILVSQGSIVLPSPYPKANSEINQLGVGNKENVELDTQTISLSDIVTSEQMNSENVLNVPDNLDIIYETQSEDHGNLDDIVGMCSGKFTQTQNVISAESQLSESQCPIGDDVFELCTGKFYDNQFVSQVECTENEVTKSILPVVDNTNKKIEEEKDLFDSIIKEMTEPATDVSNTKKYVFDNAPENDAVSFDAISHARKKFVIDSDDESNGEVAKPDKKKKLKKKRKAGKRALRISDDEEEDEETLQSDEQMVDDMSDLEGDGEERIVEYDSEENEASDLLKIIPFLNFAAVEVKPQKQKKSRKMTEFFEQEAELTSEDEWVGSGDEDEAGLDRMEREAGDDDKFHEGQLQRELGQIHMRDVLDQDKREVRLIQELLFEDGDLGDGHRQRKFRWKNIDGEEETGDTVPTLFGDSQELEFESEEQWRKQRHEREVFLRSMQKDSETDDKNVSIDRSKIIKANLSSKTMSSLLLEINETETKSEEVSGKVEKKQTKEESCPLMPLQILKQSYHGSSLTRGGGALARLAALAMPLAAEADDDKVGTIGPSSKRNFVFTAVTPTAPKVTKRKAENVNMGTPRLIKKLKTEEKQKLSKSSLIDHLTTL
ncbi:hypothetical protein MSG28_006948 [Choristoneura fumiferana]|uniref:Uncharacterized protein n=1 Tax=Choristoneura fumiferana TaxID=7141 RepID=A0ACC0JLT3_CHOFU|nr:hypothetical protein MSG28_006948 [Choristoneura fumiferana]